MTSSRLRLTLAGAGCAALVLFPALSRAQSPPANGDQSGRNLTQQAQTKAAIALPSFAPLAEHVLPAVVNISIELAEQANAQKEGDTQGDAVSCPPCPAEPRSISSCGAFLRTRTEIHRKRRLHSVPGS